MINFKYLKRFIFKEKKLILKEFYYFRELEKEINKTSNLNSVAIIRKLGRIERRTILFREKLFLEFKHLEKVIFEEHQRKLKEQIIKIEIFTNNILKRISLVEGTIPILLKKNGINLLEINQEINICFAQGIEPLSALLIQVKDFIDTAEDEINKKINLLLTLKLIPADTIVLLLVLFGRKPACMVSLEPELYGKKYGFEKKGDLYLVYAKENINFDKKDVDEFIKSLDYLGLNYYYSNNFQKVFNEYNQTVLMQQINFWVAKGKLRLQALLNAKGDVQIGRALGFPETALGKLETVNTVGYLRMLQKKYTSKNIPNELLYLMFTPKFNEKEVNKEHIDWGKANMELVKEIAPDLHDAFINSRKRTYFKVTY